MLKKIKAIIKSSLTAVMALALIILSSYLFLCSDYTGRKTSEALSGYFGRDINVKNLSGNFITKTVFNGVELKRSGEAPSSSPILRSLKADSAGVQYSILSILKNQKIAIRNFDLSNIKVNISHDKLDSRLSFTSLINSFKNGVSQLFYNNILNFYINKINVDQLTLIFENFNAIDKSLVIFNGLKILPKNIFMNSYYFESLVEMLHGREVIIPSCRVKGEIDFNNMAFKLFIEAERIKLADFNWLTGYFSPGYHIENGILLTSAVINYSQPEGLQIFGSAVIKNLAVNNGGIYNISGDTLNISFNENSIKLINSKIKIEDIVFTVNGLITDIFSSENLKASLNVKSINTQAEKYLALIKKYFNDETASSYYSTGAIDIESEIAGLGNDYFKWEHKTCMTFKNVDLTSQKLSLAFERINGRIEGDSRGFKTAAPLTVKAGNRWHELAGEVKNYKDYDKMTYNLTLKEHVSTFQNENLSITEDEGCFIAFDYDETDEEWGGDDSLNGAQTAAAISLNASKNIRGCFCTLNARLDNVAVNGIFGIDRSRINSKLSVRNKNISFTEMTVFLPGASFGGDLKISAGNGGKYLLNIKSLAPSVETLQSGSAPANITNKEYCRNDIKSSGRLDSFNEDVKNIFAGLSLKSAATQPVKEEPGKAGMPETKKIKADSALDIRETGAEGTARM